jgi:hypothetical protein
MNKAFLLARKIDAGYADRSYKAIKRLLSRCMTNWHAATRVYETLYRFFPGVSVDYSLHAGGNIHRCKCCGGYIQMSVKGRIVHGYCGFTELNPPGKSVCEKYDPRIRDCSIPGNTCRDTPGNKFTRREMFNDRMLLLFKAFKVAETVHDRGWCKYYEGGRMTKMISLLVDSGFRVFLCAFTGEKMAFLIVTKDFNTMYPFLKPDPGNPGWKLREDGKTRGVNVDVVRPNPGKAIPELHARFAGMLKGSRFKRSRRPLPRFIAF